MLLVKKNNSNNLLEEHKVKNKSLPPSLIPNGNNCQQFFGHPLSLCMYKHIPYLAFKQVDGNIIALELGFIL